MRRQVNKSKELNEVSDVMRELRRLEVSTKRSSNLINSLDITIKFLSGCFGSKFARPPSLAFGIYSEFFQIEFLLIQVFTNLIIQAEVYDEDQVGTSSIESQ